MTIAAVAALESIHADLRRVLDEMSDDDWSKPSGCGGWRVQDVFAHITSNLKEVADPTPPPAEPGPALPAEQAMEALVAPRKSWTKQDLLDEYDRCVGPWLATMRALQDEPTASTLGPLADLGTYPMHLIANAYAFDHYCHVRIDLLAPRGPLAVRLDEPTDDVVAPGIEWMLAGLPQMQVEDLRVLIRPIALELTGPGGGTWTLRPADPAGSANLISVAQGADEGVAATVTSSAHDFVSWGTARSPWRASCQVTGDEQYAASVLDHINII